MRDWTTAKLEAHYRTGGKSRLDTDWREFHVGEDSSDAPNHINRGTVLEGEGLWGFGDRRSEPGGRREKGFVERVDPMRSTWNLNYSRFSLPILSVASGVFRIWSGYAVTTGGGDNRGELQVKRVLKSQVQRPFLFPNLLSVPHEDEIDP